MSCTIADSLKVMMYGTHPIQVEDRIIFKIDLLNHLYLTIEHSI